VNNLCNIMKMKNIEFCVLDTARAPSEELIVVQYMLDFIRDII